VLTPASGTGSGLTATYYANTTFSGTPVVTRVEPTPTVNGTPSITGLPAAFSATWTGTLTPATSGRYGFSASGNGAFKVFVDGRLMGQTYYADFPALDQGVINLTAGHPVSIKVEYAAINGIGAASLNVGWQPPDPSVQAQAVQAAKSSDVAVIFANDVTGEGSDRSTLALPGDQDQLIEAVAAANPHTVVVLNTGGAVLMPWLDKVAGVIESWYPGQEFGTAIAALLWGDVNPAGRLPMTFPASDAQVRASVNWPGTILTTPAGPQPTVDYTEGIDVGYRWYQATGQTPLFPFGYGLSYTSFAYHDLRVFPADRDARAGDHHHHGLVDVHLRVTNTGSRAGADVVELYLGMPAGAGEPPRQLKGFDRIWLEPGASTDVSFTLDEPSLSIWENGSWAVPRGTYQVMAGQSSADILASASFHVGPH
jgi:beta-glucosidase